MNWSTELRDQLSWGVRADEQGHFRPDVARPAPTPAPLTTIGWRLCHIIGGVLSARNARYFGGRPFDARSFARPGNAQNALAKLDQS